MIFSIIVLLTAGLTDLDKLSCCTPPSLLGLISGGANHLLVHRRLDPGPGHTAPTGGGVHPRPTQLEGRHQGLGWSDSKGGGRRSGTQCAQKGMFNIFRGRVLRHPSLRLRGALLLRGLTLISIALSALLPGESSWPSAGARGTMRQEGGGGGPEEKNPRSTRPPSSATRWATRLKTTSRSAMNRSSSSPPCSACSRWSWRSRSPRARRWPPACTNLLAAVFLRHLGHLRVASFLTPCASRYRGRASDGPRHGEPLRGGCHGR